MGRYMMIMAGGLMGLFGIVILTMQNKAQSGVQINARSANEVQASNIAHAATDIAIEKLSQNKNWRTNGTPWTISLDNGSADVSVQDASGDQVELVVMASHQGVQQQVRTVVEADMDSIIPKVYSALSIFLQTFDFNGYGSFGVDGNDESGQKEALPGISVVDESARSTVIDGADGQQIIGEGGQNSVDINSGMDFQSTMNFVDKIENSSSTQYISGNFKGELGSETNPGVFMVDQELKLTGNTTGYGIMVIRNNGELDLSGMLDLKGTFDFHGLIIFEDGWALDGGGTSIIHGGVAIGGSEYYDYTTIDLGGTFDIKYNSASLEFAKMAAASAFTEAKFNKVSVYE